MAQRKDARRGLGRGLSALIGDAEAVAPVAPAAAPDGGEGVQAPPAERLPVDRIDPNPAQPRRRFEEADLTDLAASIRERGILQPLIVRPDPAAQGRYQIVAGERRWRAAQAAQLHEVPVVVRELDDAAVLEIAIIENVQRADLSPVEEAQGYAQLIERFSYTQDALARIVGKSRSHLANMLRLLALPESVRTLLDTGALTAGHARALIGAPDPEGLAREVVSKGLTVRQVEQRARKPARGEGRSGGDAGRPGAAERDADTRLLEGDLSAAIGMAVRIAHAGGDAGGEVRIRYRSLEELDRLCRRLAE